MPNKHLIFLVHGIGDHAANWSESAQKTIKDQYATYAQLSFIPFDERFAFVPILYNDEFEALRKKWRDSTAALGTALAGGAAVKGTDAQIVSDLNDIAKATNKDTFINTHVVDVLLYVFARQTAGTVRESVRKQIFTALTALNRAEPITWSIIAHSLGTAVIHDALHEAYSDKPTKFGEKLAGITRPTLLAMIANVSRVCETDCDVYKSRTRPGSPHDPDAVCRFYMNAHHDWDPIPKPKAFRPALHWPSIAVRMQNLYVDAPISEIEQQNVHDLDHYLRNPLVHVPIFNCMLNRIAIDGDTLKTVHARFAAQTPLDRFGEWVATLKKFQLGEEASWKSILPAWAATLKL